MENFVLGLSPYSNFLSLVTITNTGKDHITCLNGIRFGSTTWVVVPHTYSRMAGQIVPLNNQLALGFQDVSLI